MDDKKICFIMCTNDDLYANEAMYFINSLNVPEGYTVDILTVQEAESMTAGYNEGMLASDAKYKVYLHQDVMIVEKDFIFKLLDIFRDKEVGMIGMVGCPEMPENRVMWFAKRIGRIYANNIFSIADLNFGASEGKYQEVEAIDGLLMATQYDIRWREDIFDKWDYYDASQSREFINAGYKVVVPSMDSPWCIHDDGFVELDSYYEQRKKFRLEYDHYDTESLKVDDSIEYPAGSEAYILQEERFKKKWKALYGKYIDRCIELADRCLTDKSREAENDMIKFLSNEKLIKEIYEKNEIAFAVVMMDILAKEREAGIKNTIIKWAENLSELMLVIRQIKFLLWEIEFLDSDEAVNLLKKFMKERGISAKALVQILMVSNYDKQKVLNIIKSNL